MADENTQNALDSYQKAIALYQKASKLAEEFASADAADVEELSDAELEASRGGTVTSIVIVTIINNCFTTGGTPTYK